MSCVRPRKRLTDGVEEFPKALSMSIRMKVVQPKPEEVEKGKNFKKISNKMSNKSDKHYVFVIGTQFVIEAKSIIF